MKEIYKDDININYILSHYQIPKYNDVLSKGNITFPSTFFPKFVIVVFKNLITLSNKLATVLF